MSTTPHLSITEFEEGQSNGDVTFNEFARDMDSLIFLTVLDRDLTAPPGGEAEGDRYLVATGGTGDWNGHDGDIAVYYGGAYFFRTPADCWIMSVADEKVITVYDGSTWNDLFVWNTDHWELQTPQSVLHGNVDSEISGLTFSATPTQDECEALRDKCEELADDVRSLRAALVTLNIVSEV